VLTRALARARGMANIEAYRTDVPLYQVVEHIVGDLRRPAYVREQDQDDHDRDTIAEDEATKEAWDRALKDLIGAVRLAKLKVRGRRPGSQLLEEISSGDFAEVVDNPLAVSDTEESASSNLISN
jgi:hypothetical protein